MALFEGAPTLTSWMAGTTRTGPRLNLLIEPDDAAATLAVFASVVVALAVASRIQGRSPDSYIIARERIWDGTARLCGAASAFVSVGVLVGGIAKPDTFLLSLSLAGVGVALGVVAVSATPQDSRDLATWARRLRQAELDIEIQRYARLEARWRAMSDIASARWTLWELVRWYSLTAAGIAATTRLLGYISSTSSWILTSALLALAAVALWILLARYAVASFREVLSREPVSALMSAVMGLALLLSIAVVSVVIVIYSAPGAASVTALVFIGTLFTLVAPATLITGARARWPHWRWFRPGLTARRSIWRYCKRRHDALVRQKRALVPTPIPAPTTSWRRTMIDRYNALSAYVEN